MIEIILLLGKDDWAIEHWDDAPDLVDYKGRPFSLRAGPRVPVATDHESEPVAVYAPDELTEEEFQDLFYALQPKVPELALKYS
jgi:hypothetical protein